MNDETLMKPSRTVVPIMVAILALTAGRPLMAQDRYVLKSPNGIAFSEFRGYDAWQVIASSHPDDAGGCGTTSLPCIKSIMGNPVIATNFELDGVVTVVDAVNGLQTLDNHEEARKQAAVADRLIVSKKTMAEATNGAEATDGLEKRLRALNPRAAMMDADSPEAGSAAVLVNGLYDPATKIADVGRWLHDG